VLELQGNPSPYGFRRHSNYATTFQSNQPSGKSDFDLLSARCCYSAVALRGLQFSDGVGSQFGSALRLFRPVFIVDRKLFRCLDCSFERILCVF
jgi:hypothetical protein